MHSFIPSSKLVVVVLICISFVICTYHVAEAAPNTTIPFPALFVFGDSIVDTGNNNYIKTISKVNFPPYGKDFPGGKPTGRFCNGKVPSDLIAEGLGIKELLPPYLDPTLNDSDLLTGVNFASGGAGYDDLTSKLVSVLSMPKQLDMFKEYITKLEKIVGRERSSAIISQSLILVVCGSNDIWNTYYGTHLRKFQYNITSYADFLVAAASSFVKDLYKLGARRVAVFGLPPLGCLPSQRTLKGGLQRKCVDSYNQVVEMFDNKLSAEIEAINAQISHPSARAVYLDLYKHPLDIILNPQKYGFQISNKACCGTGLIEVIFLCRFACKDDNEYVFWDSFHFTEKAYKIVVHEILDNLINSFAQ